MEREGRRGSLVGPVILIGAGVIFLLNNLGLLSWSVWDVLFRFWPVLLIAAGLDILIGRRSALGSLVVVMFLLASLGVAIWLAGPQAAVRGDVLTTEEIRQPLEGARQAEVEIRSGVGELRIGALPEASGLIEGRVALDRGERVMQDFRVSGETAYYSLRSENPPTWWPFNFAGNALTGRVWDLELSRDVPIELNFDTGIGRARLDLSRLQLTEVTVDGGIGEVEMTLPRQGRFQVSIDGGIGNVRVLVPAGLAARISVDGGLGNIDVNGDYERDDDVYTSRDYDAAENRVDMHINGGIGQISVRELPSE